MTRRNKPTPRWVWAVISLIPLALIVPWFFIGWYTLLLYLLLLMLPLGTSNGKMVRWIIVGIIMILLGIKFLPSIIKEVEDIFPNTTEKPKSVTPRSQPLLNSPVILSKFEDLKNGEWNELKAGTHYQYLRGKGDRICLIPSDTTVIIDWQKVGNSSVGHKTRFDSKWQAISFQDKRDSICCVPWEMSVTKDCKMFIEVKK